MKSFLFADEVSHEGFFGLPTYIVSDLLALALFGLVLVVFVAFGTKLADRIWTKLDLEQEVQKGNVAAGIVKAALIIGLCLAIAMVAMAIIG